MSKLAVVMAVLLGMTLQASPGEAAGSPLGGGIPVTVRQATCTPRPRVTVSSAIIGGGRLDVTVTAGSGSLARLQFGAGVGQPGTPANAVVDIAGGPSSQSPPFTYTPPPGTNSVTFRIWRGEGTGATTVPLVATDACGDWRTFVGAGPGRLAVAPGLRATTDRPDEVAGYQIHVIYALPSDGEDRRLDVDGTLARSVGAFENWLAGQTGGRRLRLDTVNGRLDISFARLGRTDADIRSNGVFVRDVVQAELRKLGFTHPQKVYAVYYDGGSTVSCGGGAWPPRLVGSVAALYLRGTPPGAPPCASNSFAASEASPGYLEFSMVHEIFHTLGAVPECAPNHALSGHVGDDPRDLMYAGSLPWRPSILDVGRNDYFDHGRADCLDIARSTFLDPQPAGAAPPPGW